MNVFITRSPSRTDLSGKFQKRNAWSEGFSLDSFGLPCVNSWFILTWKENITVWTTSSWNIRARAPTGTVELKLQPLLFCEVPRQARTDVMRDAFTGQWPKSDDAIFCDRSQPSAVRAHGFIQKRSSVRPLRLRDLLLHKVDTLQRAASGPRTFFRNGVRMF